MERKQGSNKKEGDTGAHYDDACRWSEQYSKVEPGLGIHYYKLHSDPVYRSYLSTHSALIDRRQQLSLCNCRVNVINNQHLHGLLRFIRMSSHMRHQQNILVLH